LQFTVPVSHASTPVHTTTQAKSGGQSIVLPAQFEPLPQSIVQTFPWQPPVHAAGQAPPGGLGLEPHGGAPPEPLPPVAPPATPPVAPTPVELLPPAEVPLPPLAPVPVLPGPLVVEALPLPAGSESLPHDATSKPKDKVRMVCFIVLTYQTVAAQRGPVRASCVQLEHSVQDLA